MKIYSLIEMIQKKINSILFRVALLSYSIFILIFLPNKFSFLTYLIVMIFYVIQFRLFISNSRLRLFNDFFIINLILLYKDPFIPISLIYVLLPILNSINFSGRKKSFLLYLLTFLTFIVQSFVFNGVEDLGLTKQHLSVLIIIIFLGLINYYTNLRKKIRVFRDELGSEIDDFYLNKDELKHPHKIYSKIIDVIHRHHPRVKVEDIICLTINPNKDKKLVIVNSSTFVWNIELEEDQFIRKIRENKILSDWKVQVDNEEKLHNLIFYDKTEGTEYIYFLITTNRLKLYYALIGFIFFLEPAFKKMSLILIGEKRFQELRSEQTRELADKIQYVTLASKTMHFIRNRLSPFQNLVTMLNNIDVIPKEKEMSFRMLMKKENETAKNELKLITERADRMLARSKHSFIFHKLNTSNHESVFAILKRNINTFFPNIDINIDVSAMPRKHNIKVQVNEEGFELFLSDWLSNMEKYNNGVVSFNFKITTKSIDILFTNNHKLSKIELDRVVSDINKDDKSKIMERTTYGLYSIKQTLTEMRVPFYAFTDKDKELLNFEIKYTINEKL